MVASFAVPAAGGVLVPVNPLLKPAQVVHILQDAGARVLITSASRLAQLGAVLTECPDLCHVVVCDGVAASGPVRLHGACLGRSAAAVCSRIAGAA